MVLSLSVGQRKLLRRAKSHDQEPKVDVNGTLLGDRPKVRYAWQIPQAAGPEIVLAGCSNAGKSTLLNAVLTSVGLTPTAPVSDKGGRTRTLNWYPYGFSGPIGWDRTGVRLGTNPFYDEEEQLTLNGRGCCIVDCFGLGRVDFSLPARRLQSWGPLLEGYIGRRRAVNTVCHLISSEQRLAELAASCVVGEIQKRPSLLHLVGAELGTSHSSCPPSRPGSFRQTVCKAWHL